MWTKQKLFTELTLVTKDNYEQIAQNMGFPTAAMATENFGAPLLGLYVLLDDLTGPKATGRPILAREKEINIANITHGRLIPRRGYAFVDDATGKAYINVLLVEYYFA